MNKWICKRRMIIWLMTLLVLCFAMHTQGATVVQTDVTTASAGNVLLGLEGQYITEVDAALKLINSYRLEAYNEGLVDRYVPIKWSADLEYIARIRAAESFLTRYHTRTNGDRWDDIESPNGFFSSMETLAWNYTSTMTAGIKQWYEEKYDYVHNTGYVTGHYTAMIDPDHTYVGLGTFCAFSDGWFKNCTAGQFGVGERSTSSVPMANPGSVIQVLEVAADTIEEYAIKGDTSGSRGTTHSMQMTAKVEGVDMQVLSGVNWSSSDTSVATVNSSGVLTAGSCGKAAITAAVNGVSRSMTFTADHNWNDGKVQKRATYTKAGSATYTCLGCGAVKKGTLSKLKSRTVVDNANNAKFKFNSKLQLQFTGPANKNLTTVTIPATVKVDGKSYKVTSIASNAFKNNTRINTVVIGQNITKIGSKAFYGCKNLQLVTIRTKKLKKSGVGSKAFSKINAAAVIKTPSSKVKSYKKVLKKAGLPAKVKVTK